MSASILIVEDEPSVREILTWRLIEEGYRCEAVPTGMSALESLQSGKQYDLMISDIRMPGMSGIQLLKEIRNIEPDMAVVMVTAVADMAIAVETLKIGAYDYITKPFNLDGVCISVERALEKRTLILKNRDYQQSLESKVEEQTQEIKNLYLNAIKSLVFALEAKDKYTEGHSRRVTRYAVEVSKRMNFSTDKLQKVYLAGLLHDIGKIGVKESVLNKPGKLTDEEFVHISEHSDVSSKILLPILRDKDVLGYVRHHHERWDGTGQPERLKGESIPIGARILAVADTFDAITSDRPYRKAKTVTHAVDEIRRFSGVQFDPMVVSSFLVFVRDYFMGVEYLRPILGAIFPEFQSGVDSLDDLAH